MEKRVSKEGICKNTSFKLRKIVCYKKKQIRPFKMILIVALIVIVIVYKRALTGTIRAVHQQPKPGQNLVIRAGFLFYFFLHRVGNGLSFFAPRPGPGSSGAKKNRNPGTDP